MTTKPRTGPLSAEEKRYITDNCRFIPLSDLAEKMGRKTQLVQDYIKSAKLSSYDDQPEDRDRVRIKQALEKRYWYPVIKKQLIRNKDVDELDVFINRWIDLYQQYKEDVVSSEEQQLNEIILLAIQLDRIRQNEVDTIQTIKRLESSIEEEYKKPEKQRDINTLARTEQELHLARNRINNFGSQIKNINDNLKNLYTAMKSTRDQRYSKVESGKNTFAAIIRRLQDDEHRISKSREVELIRIATEKKREQLEGYHTFADGAIDVPVLNHNSAQKIIEDENKEEER